MSLHQSRRSPARRIDDTQLLQGLLTQRLYVSEHDRRLVHVLLAETPQPPQIARHVTRRRARRLRGAGAVLALSGALALALGSPLMTAVAAGPAPAAWVAVTDRAVNNLAAPVDQSDVLLRALLNHAATARAAAAPADQSDALLRALLNHTATARAAAASADQSDALLRAMLNHTTASQVAAPAEQSDALLRALLNRTTASQAAAPAAQTLPQADAALAQAELVAGETLVIPAAQGAANAVAANVYAPTAADSIYVVQPGDTLSGIALAFYGNGNLWPTIFNANTDKIANPHWIYPNQQLVIPAVYSASTTPSTPAQTGKGPGQYTVQSGDTLSGIAAYAYGNGNAWWGIYRANTDKIYNPDLIFPGQVLTIP